MSVCMRFACVRWGSARARHGCSLFVLRVVHMGGGECLAFGACKNRKLPIVIESVTPTLTSDVHMLHLGLVAGPLGQSLHSRCCQELPDEGLRGDPRHR
eukprot:4330795-Alexandrium_andersonii.AAC.1